MHFLPMEYQTTTTIQNGILVLPNAPSTKSSVTEIIQVLHNVEASSDAILAQMQFLTRGLCQNNFMAREMPCIGDILALHLIACAGIETPPCQFCTFYVNNRHISEHGNRYLRKTSYGVMHKSAGDPAFTVIEKKRRGEVGQGCHDCGTE